ncbi:hypothetical protein MHC_01800 [Mycoplasma haemocanis str. Illinois]|uniref:Uncharacterized protein n=1 Tax=Mycoplasma haemocanis (strain Illinois) TaxID=1111676 RepID=H6N6F4_MYCHN|nr:hypothetical protein [Mycoplasma haemocanis]AEW45226.1 hypothetical protein MHC_01800 [Mycoplasma haemocanis str. Illinois]
MNKSVLLSLGVVGAGGAGIGGFLAFRPSSSKEAVTTFATKYKSAILNFKDNSPDTSLWNAKFKSLSGKQPTNERLKDAASKVSTSENEAKNLYKQGCEEIYSHSIKDQTYFNDFKNYCSKTVKEGLKGEWINGAKGAADDWKPSLTALKEYESKTKGPLHKDFEEIKKSLTSADFTDDQRGKLKALCDIIGTEIFEEDTSRVKNAKSFCIKSAG